MPSANPVLIYLAGPLFSEAERSFNDRLTQRLEKQGFRVFLPQRDSVELCIAYTHRRLGNVGKLLVGLHTDTRAAFTSPKLNPMVHVPLDWIGEDEVSLMEILEGYRILQVPSS